jgi:MFS family permease
MVGTMASIMSSTVVNVAIPGLSHQFALGQARAQWVSSGFMVAMTVSMLTTPWLLARFGYRATYNGCMLVLLAGGALGGFAQNYAVVLSARVLEGLAAGAVQPIPAIIVMRAFEPHEQGRASACSAWAWCWRRRWAPRSVACWWTGSAGARSSSWWRRFAWPPCGWPGATCRRRRRAARRAPRRGAGHGGLLLGSAGTLALLNGLVALRGGTAAEAGALLGLALACGGLFIGWQRRRARAARCR